MRAFKIYMYGISTWQVPQWQAADFSLRLIHPAITEAAEAVRATRLPIFRRAAAVTEYV